MSGRAGMGKRRTRVYDCNYNIGESYYKPALDRMDRKYSGRPEYEPRVSSFEPEPFVREPFAREPFAREPLPRESIFSREPIATGSGLDDGFFDVRGNRTARGRPLSTAIEEDDFDDEVSASLRRLRANKKQSRFAEDLDFDTSFDRTKKLSDKILDSVGINSSEMSSARRAFADNEERTEKRIARRLKDEDASLTKWTALNDSAEESAAAIRAKASRARLNDLEDEMLEMNEKQAAREQRVARLRALVADSDSAADTSSMKISMKSEKKQVTF